MSKQNIYDVYKRPNGLFYRVQRYSPLHLRAELFRPDTGCWWPSAHKVGGLISSKHSTLVARNAVFKDSVCSQ